MGMPDDLEWIPRSVRDKLDRAGIKLHLKEWQALGLDTRQLLVETACDDADGVHTFRQRLVSAVKQATGKEPDALVAKTPD